ncbi:hypothetical protein OMCYN_01310 [cyanobiont of Ornithocercus magnificus]|nr:hypothetical protein OMCYN_01310 [cyanobiont of Ornithocercus magnificus]
MNQQSLLILLLAPKLLAESLALRLTSIDPRFEVLLDPDDACCSPSVVIWSINSTKSLASLRQELLLLQERWITAPVLLLLPGRLHLTAKQLFTLDCAGLVQNPDLETLRQAVMTLEGGGRIIRLNQSVSTHNLGTPIQGLSQWLLLSGLQQIDHDSQIIESSLSLPSCNSLTRLLLEGRLRELHSSRNLLLWLWGPLQSDLWQEKLIRQPAADELLLPEITLQSRNAEGVWQAIKRRLDMLVSDGLSNGTGRLLAIEGLNPERQRDLLLALLYQLNAVMQQLRSYDNPQEQLLKVKSWATLQPELRRQAMCTMAGSYVKLPRSGKLTSVVDSLVATTNMSTSDEELPDAQRMLFPLLQGQPVLVDGQLLPVDDPRALLQLETLVSNWLVRSAELISAEILSQCGAWPELRPYLLNQRLISTRSLERLRNRLNNQQRWQSLVERPIRLYESRRLVYWLRDGRIETLSITEPRDEELQKLDWWPSQVALLLEARDALAPQFQSLVRQIGNLLAIVLTEVIGRAIGLIGRGIARGMGRG